MSARKTRLVDCDPRWGFDGEGVFRCCYVRFDCPEGHEHCFHVIPFTPALDGTVMTSTQKNGAIWDRDGDTFATLTLKPSIRRIPQYASRAAALAAGCVAEYVTPSMLCALHIHITNGIITFEGDSR